MQIEEIQQLWHSFYGDVPPISHILREQFPGFWMRIHSLPKSKRYPKTPSEYSILLERHNAVATEVLGHNSNCLLLVPRYVYVGSKKERLPRLKDSNFELFSEIKAEDEEEDYEAEDGIRRQVWCAPIIWLPHQFDFLIKTVARDRDRCLFVSVEKGEIYAPYDGGADLFLHSFERGDELKLRYKDWLSSHPVGL